MIIMRQLVGYEYKQECEQDISNHTIATFSNTYRTSMKVHITSGD